MTEVFPEGASSFDITFSLTDDNVTLEVVETLIASLRLTNPHPGIVLGSPYQAFINIQDDDGEDVKKLCLVELNLGSSAQC